MEYETLFSDKPISKEQLSHLAIDRWQLVAILPWNGKFVIYLMRNRAAN